MGFLIAELMVTLYCGALAQCGGQISSDPKIEVKQRNLTRADRYDYYDGKITLRTPSVKEEVDGFNIFNLIVVTDMDHESKGEHHQWRAVTRNGTLSLSSDKTIANVTWDSNSDVEILSGFSYNDRGMELSDLVEYDGRILAPDDKTGIIFEIKDNKALPWVILNAGPGNTTEGAKAEWMTVKDGLLYAGSHGSRIWNSSGDIVSEDPLWIKVITKKGEVRSIDWRDVYTRIQEFAGFPPPGYMKHEAVQWSNFHDRWFFLPRKASKTNQKTDEKSGTNVLIIADPALVPIGLVVVGSSEHPERCFSAFAFVPGTNDSLIAALKTKEVEEEEMESFVTVFDIDGNVLLDDQRLEGNYKFEGIYFT